MFIQHGCLYINFTDMLHYFLTRFLGIPFNMHPKLCHAYFPLVLPPSGLKISHWPDSFTVHGQWASWGVLSIWGGRRTKGSVERKRKMFREHWWFTINREGEKKQMLMPVHQRSWEGKSKDWDELGSTLVTEYTIHTWDSSTMEAEARRRKLWAEPSMWH